LAIWSRWAEFDGDPLAVERGHARAHLTPPSSERLGPLRPRPFAVGVEQGFRGELVLLLDVQASGYLDRVLGLVVE
jgi:hypothetical protein